MATHAAMVVSISSLAPYCSRRESVVTALKSCPMLSISPVTRSPVQYVQNLAKMPSFACLRQVTPEANRGLAEDGECEARLPPVRLKTATFILCGLG